MVEMAPVFLGNLLFLHPGFQFTYGLFQLCLNGVHRLLQRAFSPVDLIIEQFDLLLTSAFSLRIACPYQFAFCSRKGLLQLFCRVICKPRRRTRFFRRVFCRWTRCVLRGASAVVFLFPIPIVLCRVATFRTEEIVHMNLYSGLTNQPVEMSEPHQ